MPSLIRVMYDHVHQPTFLRVFIKRCTLLREGELTPFLLEIPSFDDALERLRWGIQARLKSQIQDGTQLIRAGPNHGFSIGVLVVSVAA